MKKLTDDARTAMAEATRLLTYGWVRGSHGDYQLTDLAAAYAHAVAAFGKLPSAPREDVIENIRDSVLQRSGFHRCAVAAMLAAIDRYFDFLDDDDVDPEAQYNAAFVAARDTLDEGRQKVGEYGGDAK